MDTVTQDKPPAAQEQPAQALSPVRGGVSVRMGVAPQNVEEAWRLSQFIANSELAPKQFRGKPQDVLIAIQYGLELGFPPMQALQSIAVINGRPSVWGDGFLALILGSSVYREHDEYFLVKGERQDLLRADDLKSDETTAVTKFWRRDRPNPIVGYFSIGQAKKASLWGKEGPWQTYPDRMLKMRARGFAGRDGFADVLRGVKTTEELLDMPDDDLPALPQRPEPIQPRRASDIIPAPAAPAPASSAAPPDGGSGQSPSAPNGGDSGPASPATEAASPRQTRGVRIVDTSFVRPRNAGVEPYYEIKAQGAHGPAVAYVTRDERIYKEAASFEGTDHLVALGWRTAKLAEKADIVNVLESLALDEA